MSNFPNISDHIGSLIHKRGNFKPFLPASGGPALLFNADFSAPVAQSFPATASGLATALGDATATPSYIWLCDESSGNLVDEIDSQALVPTSSPLQDRTALIYDGTSYTNKKAVEFTAGINSFVHADNTFLDPDDTSSIAFLWVGRVPITPGSASSLAGKSETISNKGFHLWVGGTTGYPTAYIHDGTTGAAATVSTNACNGAPFAVIAVIDRTADEIRCYSTVGTSSTSSSAAVGSATNTEYLRLGRSRFSSPQAQCAYFAAFTGAAAEALDQTALDTFWTTAQDPSGLLTTATRASAISRQTSASTVGHFSDDQLPIGFNSSFTSGMGLRVNSATTNLLQYSEDFTQVIWSKTNASVSSSPAGDAPDRFQSAYSLTASASPGHMSHTYSVSASTAYTNSVWVKRNGGADVDGELRIRDVTNATTLQTVPFTATDTWQLVTATGTMGVGASTASIAVQVDTNTESILVWGAMANLGDSPASYARTNGATSTLAYSDYEVVGTAGQFCKAATGEIESVCVANLDRNVQQYVCTVSNGSTTANARAVRFDSSGDWGAFGYNSSAGIEFNLSEGVATVGAEATALLRWDDSGGLALGGGEDATFSIDGTAATTDVGTFTSSETITSINIGTWLTPSSATSLDGDIQSVKIWDAEGGAS